MNREHWNALAREYKCDLRAIRYDKGSLQVSIYEDKLFQETILNGLRNLKISLKSKTLLDIGCGIGRQSYLFSDMGAEAVGIDISHEMINNAKSLKRNKEYPLFTVGSASRIPFWADYFDLILSVVVLQHILDETQIQDACREILRVLKPFGYIILLEETSKTGIK